MKRNQIVTDRASILAVPVPAETETYTPVPASLIFNTIDRLCTEFSVNIQSEEFFCGAEGERQRLRFFFNIPNSEFVRELVVINSYNKTIALRAASGTSVFVCSNGMVLGDIKIYRKHTGTIDEEVEQFLRECFVDMMNIYQHAEATKQAYSDIIITKQEVAHILGECFFEYEYLTSSQLNIVKKEFEKPSFNYGVDPNSLWQFYNHLTYALQKEDPGDYLNTRIGIQKMIAEFYERVSPFEEVEYTEFDED